MHHIMFMDVSAKTQKQIHDMENWAEHNSVPLICPTQTLAHANFHNFLRGGRKTLVLKLLFACGAQGLHWGNFLSSFSLIAKMT